MIQSDFRSGGSDTNQATPTSSANLRHNNIIPNHFPSYSISSGSDNARDVDLDIAITNSLVDSSRDEDLSQIQNLLRANYDKQIIKIDGFGDCQFMALSHQLYGTPQHHLSIRLQCCAYIEKHPDQFHFDAIDHFDLADYLSRMRRPACIPGSSYGDEATLAAFFHLTNRPVYQFFLSNDKQMILRIAIAGEPAFAKEPSSVLNLYYDRHRLHYDSVVPLCWRPPTNLAVDAGPLCFEIDDPDCETNPNDEREKDLASISRLCNNNYRTQLNNHCVQLFLLWLDKILALREGASRKTFVLHMPFSERGALDTVLRGLFASSGHAQHDPDIAETFLAIAIQHGHFWAYEVNIKSGDIFLNDSLYPREVHAAETSILRQCLSDFFPTSKFNPVTIQPTPCQNNGIDCGVFASEVLRRKVFGEDVTGFSQENINDIRSRMEAILTRELPPLVAFPAARIPLSGAVINLADDDDTTKSSVTAPSALCNAPPPRQCVDCLIPAGSLSSSASAAGATTALAAENDTGDDTESDLVQTSQAETHPFVEDIFTPVEVINKFISTVCDTLQYSTSPSAVRWLVLPTDAHLTNAGKPAVFSRLAASLGLSFDIIDKIVFPIHLNEQELALVVIEISSQRCIRLIRFEAGPGRPVPISLSVAKALSNDYGNSQFTLSFSTSTYTRKSSLSSGTAACAMLLHILTPSSQILSLSDTSNAILRATHLGFVESLLPVDPATGQPIKPLDAHRKDAAEKQADFDAKCSAHTNKALLELCVPALRSRKLALCESVNTDNSLIRTLILQILGNDCDLDLVQRECSRLQAEVIEEANCAGVILHFCRKFNCQVRLFEFLDGALSELLFHGDGLPLDQQFSFYILHGYEDQFFALKDWTPPSYAEAVADATPPVPQFSISVHNLRGRRDNRRARRQRTQQIVKFLSPRSSEPPPQPVPDDLVQLRDIVVALQNTNSYTTSPVGLEAWTQLISHYQPDIAINVDARATQLNARVYEDSLRLQLKGYNVSVFPTAVEKTRTVHDDVGSIIITISPRLSSHVDCTFRDPLELGVVAGVLLKTPAMNILVMGVYWMTKPSTTDAENNNSLWARTKRRLQRAKLNVSPLQYVKSSSEDLLMQALKNNWKVIYAGDLNSGYGKDEGQHHDCEPWASRFDLRNLPLEYIRRNSLAPIVTRFASNGTGRAIDHILTDLPSRCSATVNPRLNPTMAETMSDHLPLIVTLHDLDLKVKPSYVPDPPRPVDLDRKRKVMVEMFSESMSEYSKNFVTPHPDDPGLAARDYIESICEFAVEDVADIIGAQHLKHPNKIKYFHGWSPTYMLHCYQLSFLYRLRRLVEMNPKTCERIPGYDVRQSIKRISDNLLRARDRLNEKSPPGARSSPLDLVLRDTKGKTFEHDAWLKMDISLIIPTILSVIPALKKCMHARKRAQDRELISAFVKRNEQRRKDRKFKQLFSAIFNRYRREIDQIVDPVTGKVTADPIELHDMITDHLSGWHCLNHSDPSIEWQQAIHDPNYLLSIPSLQRVPQPLLKKLSKSFTRHSQNQKLRDSMKNALSQEISFEEYMSEVRAKSNNKSPGISGFTINMLKEFPEEVQRHLHGGLCEIWSRRNDPSMVPESWYARWICAVPKKKHGPIALDSIRPISLYEVLRKVWTSIITARISRVWTELKVLHPTQYGYQFAMGTDTELIQVINVVEDAAEFKKRLILTAFDTTKAFDSVNKPLMVAAWTRLGVPIDIADYLVNMDVGGDTLVKTAHAKSVIGKLKKGQHLGDVRINEDGAKSSRDTVRTFTARDGIGQGDSPSANAWIAIYDILLCALDEIDEDPYRFQKRDDEISTCTAAAYADDLQTFSPTVEHAQAAINIVSAFNCVTGFTTNISKMHCGTNLSEDLGHVRVYDRNWVAHLLPIKPEMEVEILGVTVDLTNRWRTLRREITDKTAEISLPLSRKRLSVESKRIAYEMVVLPTLLYKAKFINLSLDEYESLLNPVNTLLRSINRLKRTSPAEVLYSDHKTAAGLQLSNIVSRIQDFKSGMFTRAMREGNPAKPAATAIIERCFRQQAINFSGSADICLSEFNCSWYSSLLERQTSSGTRLYRNSPSQSSFASHQPIRELCNPQHIDLCDTMLAQFDITIVRDLTAETRGQPFRRWFVDHPVVPLLRSFPHIPNNEPNILQIGKLYLSKSKTIHEFCGWERDSLYFREWKVRGGHHPSVNSSIYLAADPQQWTKYTDSFCFELYAHVYALGRTNQKGVVTSTKILAIQPDSTPVRREIDIITSSLIPPPKSDFLSPYRLYTDGAHRNLLTAQQIIFGVSPCDFSTLRASNSSGGVIYKDCHPIQTLTVTGFDDQIIPNSGPYESEAIGLLAGLNLLGNRALKLSAFTDSKVLIDKLRRYRTTATLEYTSDPLIALLHQIICRYQVDLQWVKGHPEKRAKFKRKDWTSNDIGIYIADKMTHGCVDDLPPLKFNCDHITPTVVQFRDLIPRLTQCTRYQYRRSDGLPMAEYQLRLLHRQKEAAEYLCSRESSSRADRKIPWTQLSLPLAVQALEYQRCISRTRVVKTMYDLYDDDLHKEGDYIQHCPLCRTSKDTTEHLFSCCDTEAIAIVAGALIEQQRLPIPQELYECDSIQHADVENLRQTIISTINLDAQTRIGMFNHQQQTDIVEVIPGLFQRDDTEVLLGVISRYIVQLLQPTVSATLGLVVLRNKKKSELSRLQLQSAVSKVDSEKKRKVRATDNPFALLFPDEPVYAEPAPVNSYEICYGSPSVKTHLLARTTEEAAAALSRLLQIPQDALNDSIVFYRLSEDHPDSHVLTDGLSLQHLTVIAKKDSIFSPLLFFPGGHGLQSFNRFRTIYRPAPSDRDDLSFINFVVQLDRIIESGHFSRFRKFLSRCRQHAEDEENRFVISDIQTIEASILHRMSISSEQLHLALMWSPEAICLKRVVRYADSVGILSGFSREQMIHSDCSSSYLPQLTCFHDTEIVVYHNDSAATPRRSHRSRQKQLQPLSKKGVRNTHVQCGEFHKDVRYIPRISTFPPTTPLLHTISPTDLLDHLQESAKILSTQYETIFKQNVDARDQDVCRKLISDTENILADEQILNLSIMHRKYLRDKLRRAILQVRSLLQETVAYDPSTSSIKHSPVASILPFLKPRQHLDNKEQPD